MKRFNLTTLLIAFAMVWAGFASSSSVFALTQMEMPPATSDHGSMVMSSTNMQDCPSHKAGKMSMDSSRCAVSCYGLATSVSFEPHPLFIHDKQNFEAVVENISQFMVSRSLSVPTPPPNFA